MLLASAAAGSGGAAWRRFSIAGITSAGIPRLRTPLPRLRLMQLKQYRSCEGLGREHALGEIRRCCAAVARNDRHYALAHYEMPRNRSAVCVFKTEFLTHLFSSLPSSISLGRERPRFMHLQREATNHNAVVQKKRAPAGCDFCQGSSCDGRVGSSTIGELGMIPVAVKAPRGPRREPMPRLWFF